MRSPLHIVILFHPESPVANLPTGASAGSAPLVVQILRRLYGAPATQELRIPTWFAPALPGGGPPPLETCWETGSETTLLVYLLDARMARRVEGGTADAWGAHLAQALHDAEANPRRRSVVPLRVDREGVEVVPGSPTVNIPIVPAEAPLEFILQHISIRALYLLSDRPLPVPLPAGRLQVPIQVFLSHAKADLAPAETHPVRQMLTALEEHAVERFFDSAKIGPGEDFALRLEGEVKSSDVLLVVWTDTWSARPWCRFELLTAKRHGRAVVVVDALEQESPRAFPYSGNTMWVRWRAPIPAQGRMPTQEESNAVIADRARVFTAVLMAALRTRFERRALGEPTDPRTVHLGNAPEALDVAANPASRTFVYPDPPLPDEERTLLAGLSSCDLVTPLGRIARAGVPARVHEVVVSVSSPGEAALRARGLVGHHVDTITDEIHLGVLVAGMRIFYGGLVNYTSSGPSNFVLRLFDVVRRYGELAQQVGRSWEAPVVNQPPWPLHLSYSDPELNLFGRLATLERAPQPALGALAYEPWPPGTFPTIDSVPRLLAVGLGLRTMRRWTIRPGGRDGPLQPGEVLRPRVLVGGPTASMGWLPGLVEEAYSSLCVGAPLYLLGGLGGAARVVADLLLNGQETDEPVMTEVRARATVTIGKEKRPAYDDARELAASLGLPFDTREDVAREIADVGQRRGLAGALANGLNDEENLELLEARDGRRILALILQGLTRVSAAAE